MVWFLPWEMLIWYGVCNLGDVKMVWFIILGDVGIVWWQFLGRRTDGLIWGFLGRRWFSLFFSLGRSQIPWETSTSPTVAQLLPRKTIRLPRWIFLGRRIKPWAGFIRKLQRQLTTYQWSVRQTQFRKKYSRSCCETLDNFQGKADRVNGELGGMGSHYWVMLASLLTLWAEAGLIENEHTSTFWTASTHTQHRV